MNYQLNTHCVNCFRFSQSGICAACNFNRDKYLKEHASNHHLPLFTKLEKGYVIGRVLGEGGFAIVYAALREADGLAFAVKEYYPESLASRGLNNCTVQAKRNETERLAVWQKRFKEEAEHLRRCQDYPAIAGVVKRADLLEQNNTVYLVMERLQGRSLRDYLTEPKSAQWILGWLKPLLATFEQLHNRQIFHRDVSPNNVFLTAENQPVLMDFGLAREGIRDSALKSSTVGAGTEGFIAPEQTMAAASSRVDARTDLYSLGGLVYMALHGELPPSAGQRAQGAKLKRCQNIDNVTAYLEKLAWHCLVLDRDKRPKNVAAIKREYALFWQTGKPEETIVPDFATDIFQTKNIQQNSIPTKNQKQKTDKAAQEKKLNENIQAQIKFELRQKKKLEPENLLWNNPKKTMQLLNPFMLWFPVFMAVMIIIFNETKPKNQSVSMPKFSKANTNNSCTGNCINGQGTYNISNGIKYEGEWKNAKPDGHGIFTDANGQYIGNFKNGKREGQGISISKNGIKYDGEWKNGTPNGHGTITDANGQYIGNFNNGKPDGQGAYSFASGDKYIGEFKNNQIDGYGTYNFTNGDRYVGEFKNSLREGKGTYFSANGIEKTGIWKNNEFVQ